MSATINRPTLARIQDLITAQLTVLRNARLRYEHSPNAANFELARIAEIRLNGLIAQWCSVIIEMQADDIAAGKDDT